MVRCIYVYVRSKMATSKSEKKRIDRFSFLDSSNGSDSSASSDDEAATSTNGKPKSVDISFITAPEDSAARYNETLPSPGDLFKTAADRIPDFLRDRTKGHIEWSKYLKNTTIPEEEAQPSSSTHTVPPPVSYDAKSAPIPPTLGFKAQETTTKRKPDDETGIVSENY